MRHQTQLGESSAELTHLDRQSLGRVDPEALKPVAPGALAAQPVAARPVASGFSPEALDDLVAKQGGVQKPVQVFDDAGNAVTFTEHYLLANGWETGGGNARRLGSYAEA